MLGMLGRGGLSNQDADVFIRTSGSLKDAVTASTASFLCWPLSVVITLSAIPMRHWRFLLLRVRGDPFSVLDWGSICILLRLPGSDLRMFRLQSSRCSGWNRSKTKKKRLA